MSKQTFRVVLYSLRRPSGSGQQFDIFFFRTSLILSKKTASVFCWEAAHQYFPAQKVLVKVKKAGERSDCGGVQTGANKEICVWIVLCLFKIYLTTFFGNTSCFFLIVKGNICFISQEVIFCKICNNKTKFWSVQLGKALKFGLSFGPKFFFKQNSFWNFFDKHIFLTKIFFRTKIFFQIKIFSRTIFFFD